MVLANASVRDGGDAPRTLAHKFRSNESATCSSNTDPNEWKSLSRRRFCCSGTDLAGQLFCPQVAD